MTAISHDYSAPIKLKNESVNMNKKSLKQIKLLADKINFRGLFSLPVRKINFVTV